MRSMSEGSRAPEEGVGADSKALLAEIRGEPVESVPDIVEPCPVRTRWCVDHSDDDFEGVVIERCEGPTWSLGRHFVSVFGVTLRQQPQSVPSPIFTVHAEDYRTPDSLRRLGSEAARAAIAHLAAWAPTGTCLSDAEGASLALLRAATSLCLG